MQPSRTEPRRDRRLSILLVVGGLVGLLAAADLLIEKIAILKNPFYVPSCTISAALSCGAVMTSPAAEAFGFPNPIIGVAAFPVVVTTGVVLLAGATLPRWYWRGLQLGVTLGVVFIHWLMFQTLYRIGALCPYCMGVWTVVIPIFLYVTLRNVASGDLPVPGFLRGVVGWIDEYRGVVLTSWYLAIIGLILQSYWGEWDTLLP